MSKKITFLPLTLMGVVSIYSLINIPIMARYGAASIICYIIAAIVFFIPSALVCAELSSGWPKAGGIYVWIKEAFGERIGFLSVWLEWINNVVVFPVSLSFTVSIISYLLPQKINFNKYIILAIILIIFWSITFVNFKGMKYSSRLSNFGFIFGTMFPSLLIIGLGIWWILTNTMQHHILPTNLTLFDTHAFKSSFLISIIMGYSGIQAIAFHAQDVENPRKNYPKAILTISVVTLLLYILSILAIFSVIPSNNMDIISGFMQAVEKFFKVFNLVSILPLIAFLIVLGRIAALNVWVIGPARGFAAALNYYSNTTNKGLSYLNKHGIPTNILIMQAILTTCFSIIYLFVSEITHVYWVLLFISSTFSLVMYMLIFAAGIVLRYSRAYIVRSFKISGGKIGIWIVAGCGFVTSFFILILSFFPPEKIYKSIDAFYKEIMLVGLIVIVTLPIIVVLERNKKNLSIYKKLDLDISNL